MPAAFPNLYMLNKILSPNGQPVKTPDELLSDGLEHFTDKAVRKIRIARLYDEFNEQKAQKIRLCANWLRFGRPLDDAGNPQKELPLKLISANFCGLRLCPMCQWRRARKLYRRMMTILTQPVFVGKEFLFITLTVPNCESDMLGDTIDKMLKAYHKLTANKKHYFSCYFLGTFRVLEVTYNAKANTYHPHIHVLACVPKTYFDKKNNSRYMDIEVLRKIWADKAELDYDPGCVPVVRIQKVRGKAKAACEVSKYSVKEAHIKNAEVLRVLDSALERKRLFALTGIFRQVDQALPDDAEADILDEKLMAIEEVIYKWNVGTKTYVPVKAPSKEMTKEQLESLVSDVSLDDYTDDEELLNVAMPQEPYNVNVTDPDE